MQNSRFSKSKIIEVLKENEAGRSVEEISRELGIAKGTFYAWRRKYGGMEVSPMNRLKQLEEENRKLKRRYADQALKLEMAKEVISNLPAGGSGAEKS